MDSGGEAERSRITQAEKQHMSPQAGPVQNAPIQLPGLPLPDRPRTLITIIVTLSDNPTVAKLQKNRDASPQHMPGGQVPQRHRQRPGPVHLKGHLITHRNSIEHIEPLAPQHPAPPLSSLKDAGQVPHRPIRKEDVGELTLHNIRMKEPGQLLPDSTTTNSLVITNRRIHKGVPLQTRHTHQRRTPPHPRTAETQTPLRKTFRRGVLSAFCLVKPRAPCRIRTDDLRFTRAFRLCAEWMKERLSHVQTTHSFDYPADDTPAGRKAMNKDVRAYLDRLRAKG